jgi:hypothetical protein
MGEWEHGGGFSLDARVRIEGEGRKGMERLLSYCARLAFALERLHEIDAGHLVYESVKPGPGGSVSLMLTPLELIDRLAALIPPPRRHRHRHYDQRKSPWDEVLPLACPRCGGEMRIIAFITEAVAVRDILTHLGEATSPPRMAPARGPPLWEMQDAGRDDLDLQAQPAPDYDQRIAW